MATTTDAATNVNRTHILANNRTATREEGVELMQYAVTELPRRDVEVRRGK